MHTQLIDPTTSDGTAAAPSADTPPTTPHLVPAIIPVGVQVELRSRFDDRWTHGFSIAACGDGEYQVRRLSDGHVLPAWFPAAMLRAIPQD